MKSMSSSAKKIMAENFLRKDSFGRVVESPESLFRRIAIKIASAEAQWSSLDDVDYYQYEYFNMMNCLEFLPAMTVLKNISENKPQLIPAYVLSVPDSIEGMADTIKHIRELQAAGVQLGFNFSNVRPQGDPVSSSRELAEGPIKFLELFNQASLAVPAQGIAANNLAAMKIDHPDIESFIEAIGESKLESFQLVVGLSSHFMRCLKKQTTFPLTNPRSGSVARFVSAREIFDKLCHALHASDNTGVLFLDELNRHQPTPHLGKIEAMTPYGAESLLDDEGSAVGLINLSSMFHNNEFDEERFEIVTDLAVRFLDNVLELNYYVSTQLRVNTLRNRKLGLGLTGFSDLLAQMDIPYDSEKARTFASTIMKLFLKRSRQASVALAKQRGAFNDYKQSCFAELNIEPMRNASLTAVASFPLLSSLFSTSSGMEPFSLNDLLSNTDISTFVSLLKKSSLDVANTLEKLRHTEDLDTLSNINEQIKKIFKVDQKISYQDQIKMQAAFQKYTDNVANKSVYVRSNTSWQDIYKLVMMAYNSKCKALYIKRRESRSVSKKKEDKKINLEKSFEFAQKDQNVHMSLLWGRAT